MASSERSSSDLPEYTLFQIEKTFFINKNKFLCEKWKYLGYIFAVLFFEMLSKFNDFVNSDDCIGKIKSKSIGL